MPGRVVIFGWSESIHVRRWVAGLSELGWQIRLISQGGGPVPGTETFNLGRRGKLSFVRHAAEAVGLAREFRPDLIHVHYAGGFGWWGLRCACAPLLVSVWGSDVVGIERNLIQRLLVRRILRRADRISVTSAFLRSATAALDPDAAARIDIIPFGVTLPDRPRPLPPPPVRLCYIKLHRPQYGPDILLRAMAMVRRTMPEVRLTFAGDGVMTPRLREMVDGLGLADAVDFVGFVPNDRIYSLLSEHHIMVMPSLSESFGVAVLEAAACGRPSIASRVGGVPEVLKDGETGLLVPPGDPEALAQAILQLAGDLARTDAMGRAARELAGREFSWKRSLDLMNRLYETMIGAAPRKN